MGAGKTTVGRALARRLAVPFRDADAEIEKAADLSVTEIFQRLGEGEFRKGERRVIARLLEQQAFVLATGGGAYMNTDTRALLKQRAITVWLRADLDLLMRRVLRRNTRPLLQTGDPRATMSRLMAERHPVYAEADLVVDVHEGAAADIARTIIEQLPDEVFG
jgi:shikimate kinase